MGPMSVRNILITGASGQLGEALAQQFATENTGRPTHLILWGRRQDRLLAVSDRISSHDVTTECLSLDLCHVSEALVALQELDQRHPLDLVIFASGAGDVRAAGERIEKAALVERLAQINFTAPATLAAAAADMMVLRGAGQIVLVGSAAAFHSLPFAAAYAGSKAGLARFGEALSIAAAPHGIKVQVVSPGFIDTEGGRAHGGERPMALSPEKAAQKIAKIIKFGKAHVIFPWVFRAMIGFDRLLPSPLRHALLRRLEP